MVRFVMLFFVALTLGYVTPTFGHPPRDMELEFDVGEHLLRVVAYHTVRDSTKHYVDRIIVELNGKEIVEQQVESQMSSEMQEVIYKIIDAQSGDEILVTASCNISGRKQAVLAVEGKAEKEEMPTGEE